MKKLLFTLTLAGALALGGQSAFAQAKKKPAEAPAAAAEKTKAAGEKPKAEGDAKAKTAKARGFYISADEIDAAGKSFTHVNKKDNKKVKYVVTATTEIANDGKPAKFEDIKAGDFVSGSLSSKSETENEIVKITKFGPKAEKPAGEAKKPAGDAKKPAEKKGEAPAKPATK